VPLERRGLKFAIEVKERTQANRSIRAQHNEANNTIRIDRYRARHNEANNTIEIDQTGRSFTRTLPGKSK
jgi:hypothetical protein